jgi:hypothetical protein
MDGRIRLTPDLQLMADKVEARMAYAEKVVNAHEPGRPQLVSDRILEGETSGPNSVYGFANNDKIAVALRSDREQTAIDLADETLFP